MTAFREHAHGAEIGILFAGEARAPARRHLFGRADRGKIAHAAERVLAAAVDDSLRRNRLARSQRGGFQEHRVITGAAEALEAPQARGAAAEDEDVQTHDTGRIVSRKSARSRPTNNAQNWT